MERKEWVMGQPWSESVGVSGLGCEQDGKNSERRRPTGERAVTGAWLVRKTGGKTVAPAAVRVRPFVRVEWGTVGVCGVSHAYRGRQRELREGGERAFMRYKWFRAPWPLVGWIGMPCDFSAESFRQPITRNPSKGPVCGKRLIRVIRAPTGRDVDRIVDCELCSVLTASLSLFGSTLAVGPTRASECYHHEGPFSQNVCPIFGGLDTDTPLLSTRPLFYSLPVPHVQTSYVNAP